MNKTNIIITSKVDNRGWTHFDKIQTSSSVNITSMFDNIEFYLKHAKNCDSSNRHELRKIAIKINEISQNILKEL